MRGRDEQRDHEHSEPLIERVHVSAFTIPTDVPEADGTLAWDSTTVVTVEVEGGGKRGLGYTYGDVTAAHLIAGKLGDVVLRREAMDVAGACFAMVRSTRNLGRPGIGSTAISAVNCALWDLKARLLNLPLVKLLGQAHPSIQAYGSGGFTSYSAQQLQRQIRQWVEAGMSAVKMKVGTEPHPDVGRLKIARDAMGARLTCCRSPRTLPLPFIRRSSMPAVPLAVGIAVIDSVILPRDVPIALPFSTMKEGDLRSRIHVPYSTGTRRREAASD